MIFAGFRCWGGGGNAGTFLCWLRPHEIVVIDEFVAVADEQIGRGLFNADADDRLVVLAQFADERRKVRIAANDDEGVDVTLGVTEIERIDDHADVGGVFAGLAHMRDLDELERCFVQPPLKRLVALKIAVGFLDHDLALEKQTLEHLADVERGKVRVMRAQRDVWRQKYRAKFGIKTITVGSDKFAFLEIMQALRRNELVAMLVDRPYLNSGVEVKFFDQPTLFSAAAARIWEHTDATIIPAFVLQLQPGRYGCYAYPPIAMTTEPGPEENSQRVADVFQAIIREFPDQWFNFVPIWTR